MTVTLATFMELLDTSIANVSLPYIGGGLGRSFDEVTWILTTYLVANAVVLPMSAWLSRVFGRKNYYMACVVLFTTASLVCGLAPTLGIMLAARIVQGVGGGGLAPVEQAILVDTFPANKRAMAFALYTVAIVTAPAIGPVLGGWITDSYTWRWVFFINIPIGCLSLVLTSRFVHDPASFAQERKSVRSADGKLRIDGIGIALVGLGSAALEFLLDRGQIDDWFGSPFILWAAIIGGTCFTAAILWELRHPDPVIDLRMLKVRNFAIANVFYFVFGVGLFASTTMIPQILQSLYGYRAIDAGLVLGPGAFVITLLAPVGAQLVQRGIVHPRILLFGAVVVVGLSFLHFSRFNLDTNYSHYAWARALQGFGYAFFFVPLTVTAYSQLRPDQNNKASSLTNFFRNWGGSVGISLVTTMSERRQDLHQSRVGEHLTSSSLALQSAVQQTASFLQQRGFSQADAMIAAYNHYYSKLLDQTKLLGFMDCFYLLGVLTLIAAPLVLLTNTSGWGAGHRGRIDDGAYTLIIPQNRGIASRITTNLFPGVILHARFEMTTTASTWADTGLEVIDIQEDAAFRARGRQGRNRTMPMEGMQRVVHAFVERPESILQDLVNAAVGLCGADSAGISIEKEDRTDQHFYQWVATAGQYSDFLNAVLPRYPSACGICLTRGRPQLFRVGQRFFDLMGVTAPLVSDGILLPWEVDETRGTIFIMAHGRAEAFDEADCRIMQMLADFAAMGVRQQKQQRLLLEQASAAAAAAMANELAHKINNPLQSLTNLLYLAVEGRDGEDRKALGQQAFDDLERLTRLVRELLALPLRRAQ